MKYFKFKPTALVALIMLFSFTASACSSNLATPQASLTTEQNSTEAITAGSDESTTNDITTEATSEPEPYYIPDFKLTALDGTETSLHAYEGQIIVINFWATWCKYCITEMPLLDELDKRDDVTVLAISVNEDQKTVQDYIDKYDYSMPVFLDENGDLASMFGVTGFPTSLFLGPDFEYFYIYPGMVDQKTLDSIFEAIDEIMKDRQ
ncbi:TlpA family protein disulfide reductase [Fusibacter bizertensis]